MSGRELGLDRYRYERERSKRRKFTRWRKKQQVTLFDQTLTLNGSGYFKEAFYLLYIIFDITMKS